MQPLILAYGNERGEDFDEFKVWSKALVCMMEKLAKTRANVFRKGKAESSGGSNITARAPASKNTIPISDDEEEHSAKPVAKGKDKVTKV